MKYLITGGCGFLGSNLAAEVLRRGDPLFILDDLSRAGSSANLSWLRNQGGFEFTRVDIRNPQDVAQVVRRVEPDVVFHLAGQVAMTTSLHNPRLDFEVNAVGTFNTLEAIRTHAPESILVYSSTNKVYGDLEQFCYREDPLRYVCLQCPSGFDESVPLDFHSPYGCSKGAADQYVLDYARIFGLKTVVLRHSSMYGARQFSTHDQGWIGWFCQKALVTVEDGDGVPFTIAGNGKQVRDVLSATDAVTCYFAAVERIDAARGQAMNIGGTLDNSLSLLELFALLEELVGKILHYRTLPPRSSDQRVFVADIGKARRLLGWEPLVSVRGGVSDMLAWLQGERCV